MYMEFKDGKISYDTIASNYSNRFTDNFSSKDYEKSMLFLDSLELIGKKDYKIVYNKAICYYYLNQQKKCEDCILEYIKYPIDKIKIGLITNSILGNYCKSETKIKSIIDSLIKLKYQTVSDPNLTMVLECVDAKEQEILLDTMYMNNRNLDDRYHRLKINFNIVNSYIKENGLPSFKTVGKSVSLFELMILHMDYNPKLQLKIAKKMLSSHIENGYDIGRTLYCIDRALRNLGKKQKYGSIILKRGKPESKIYKYRGTLKKINRKRAKYKVVSINQEKLNLQINQAIK